LAALLVLTAAWVPVALLHRSLWALLVGVVLLDLAVQAVHVLSQARIYALELGAVSRVTASYMLFYSLGSALGSLAAGALHATAGWGGVCVAGAAVSVLALAVAARLPRTAAARARNPVRQA
ncbi:MAG TPA: MFS transporter, partial [Solirubrobacteraceae bacterium]|nr:MFS transporter [Solirubrobacteraceae bacterium]